MAISENWGVTNVPRAKRASNANLPAWARALRVRRAELGISQEEAAARSEVLNQTTISELENGKYELGNLTAARLAALARGLQWTLAELERAVGVDFGLGAYVESMQTQQMHTEYQQQPVYKLNGLIQDDATPFEYAWLPPGRGDDPKFTKALLIEDTDMERLGRSLHPDDIVFVRTDETAPIPDNLYAIVHESKVMIRRYVETPIGAAFAADNPALSGQLISPSKVTIVGHVYRVFSDFNNYGN